MTQNKQPETESLTVVLELPGREHLIDLLSTMEERDLPIVTRDIRREQDRTDQSARVDLGALTAKQRQTLEIAIESGYYERPRASNLDELANQLDISKSAVSQRLRAAERKLIEDALRPVV